MQLLPDEVFLVTSNQDNVILTNQRICMTDNQLWPVHVSRLKPHFVAKP